MSEPKSDELFSPPSDHHIKALLGAMAEIGHRDTVGSINFTAGFIAPTSKVRNMLVWLVEQGYAKKTRHRPHGSKHRNSMFELTSDGIDYAAQILLPAKKG